MTLESVSSATVRLMWKTAIKENELDVFNQDVGIIATACIWEKYAYSSHLKATRIYSFFVLCYTLTVYSFSWQYKDEQWIFAIVVFLHLLSLACWCYGVFLRLYKLSDRTNRENKVHEIIQQTKIRLWRTFYKMLTLSKLPSFWNFADTIIFICLPIGMISRLIHLEDTDLSSIALSICSMFVWFKLLYFMRPFSISGPLVSMIMQIAADMRVFILIVFFVLAGFAQSFWLLSYHQENGKFFSIRYTHYYSIMYMLGQEIDPVEFDESRIPLFSFFLLVIFLVTMMVLMLNLLIALMQDTYERVRQKGRAQWRMEQAEVMLGDLLLSRKHKQSKIKTYIHVLKYATDVMHDESRSKESR